jgi:hypothetical protein
LEKGVERGRSGSRESSYKIIAILARDRGAVSRVTVGEEARRGWVYVYVEGEAYVGNSLTH